MRFGANSMARCWVRACKPAFAIEYAEDGVATIACLAHIDPMFTIAPGSCRATRLAATFCVMKKNAVFNVMYGS
jgi:hypothetical protein